MTVTVMPGSSSNTVRPSCFLIGWGEAAVELIAAPRRLPVLYWAYAQKEVLTMSIDTYHLRYFVAVAQRMNFTRAAEDLSMATSPLSRRIRDFERQLGVQLFERKSREVILTAAGRRLLPRVKDVLERFDALKSIARDGEPTEIILGVAPSTPPELAAATAAILRTSWPDATIVIESDGYAELGSALIGEQIDLAFQAGPRPNPTGFEGFPALTWHLGITMRLDDPMMQKTELALSDLADQRFVMQDDGTGLGRLQKHLLDSAGITEIEMTSDVVRAAYEVSSRGAYTLGVLETSPPIAKVLSTFDLGTRRVEGLDESVYTWLRWTAARAAREPYLRDAGRRVREGLSAAGLIGDETGLESAAPVEDA